MSESTVAAVDMLNMVTSCLLTLNVVILGVELQYRGYKAASSSGFVPAGRWPDLDLFFKVCSLVFTVLFLLDLIFRVTVLRRSFFRRRGTIQLLNWFDVVLVLGSCLCLLSSHIGNYYNMTIMTKLFGCLRVIRMYRVIETVKVFAKLKVLVNTVMASFLALFWGVFLLVIVMLVSALFLCQALTTSIEDNELAIETRRWLYLMYGTSTRSFYTVFELTFSGCWPNYVRQLVEEVNVLYSVFFVFYIIAVTFAIFRIITALFLRDTMALAASDAEVAVQARMAEKQRYASNLLDFFLAADLSGDGFLSQEEFDYILENQKVKSWLSVMDLDIHETEEFFDLLAGDDGKVSSEEFVEGILRLKGQARSQDLVAVRYQAQKMALEISDIKQALTIVLAKSEDAKGPNVVTSESPQ